LIVGLLSTWPHREISQISLIYLNINHIYFYSVAGISLALSDIDLEGMALIQVFLTNERQMKR
jgi:hypothetical protein